MPFNTSICKILGETATIFLAGCCTVSGTPSPAPDQNKCASNGPPNSEQVIGTSCKVVVQMREVCVYDEEGRLKDITSKPDGVCFCIGTSF